MSDALRVCYVVGAHPAVPCGIGDFAAQLARDLSARGVTIGLVTTNDPRLAVPPGLTVVEAVSGWGIRDLPRLVRAIRDWRPDIVHVQFPGVGYGRGLAVTLYPLAARLTAGRRRPRIVVTLHEFHRFSWRWRTRVALGLALADVVTAPDPVLARRIQRALRPFIVKPAVRFLPLASNVVDVGVDGPIVDAPQLRRTRDELVVGFFGFFGPDKGIETLLEAFALVRERRPARLAFVGTAGSEAGYWSQQREKIARSPHRGDIVEVGWVPAHAVSAVLRQFDVCALPFREGVAMNRTSFHAALAHGLPTVTTATEPRFDAARNTEYVAPNDPSQLALAILRAAERAHVRPTDSSLATPDSVARQHLELYSALLPTAAKSRDAFDAAR